MQNPRQYKIPDWFLNRQKDIRDGKFTQVLANSWESKLREDLERLKKIKAHRGLRHYWGCVCFHFNCICNKLLLRNLHPSCLCSHTFIACCVPSYFGWKCVAQLICDVFWIPCSHLLISFAVSVFVDNIPRLLEGRVAQLVCLRRRLDFKWVTAKWAMSYFCLLSLHDRSCHTENNNLQLNSK